MLDCLNFWCLRDSAIFLLYGMDVLGQYSTFARSAAETLYCPTVFVAGDTNFETVNLFVVMSQIMLLSQGDSSNNFLGQ